ncbi:MAG TPA: beta-eliminating lyase-related protein [Allosphingosinicella sp.]|nr:beta-eliminating lyase-related protein [Allosphingosinicella sp.]
MAVAAKGEISRRGILGALATLGITGPAASAIASQAGSPRQLREAVMMWHGLDPSIYTGGPVLPPSSSQYLERAAARFGRMTPLQIAERVKELSQADADWRRRKCISLRAAEGLMSPGAQALLDSTLATRVSEGFPGAKDDPGVRGTDEYIDEIEAALIYQVQKLFGAKYVEWRPLSNSMANALPYLVLTKPGDVVMAQAWVGGGANAANTPVGPGALKDLVHVQMPVGENYEHDVDGIRRLAREVRPRFIVAGGGKVLFPYPLGALREIADEVGAKVMYDGAHLGILIAGGLFQRPLQEGAHIMTMSTHKAFGGPVGGLLLTNDSDIAGPIMHRTLNGFIQTRDANKLVAAAYTMAEVSEHGRAYAAQMVRNAKAFGAALESEGFKVLARDKGYTETHHIIVDVSDKDPVKARADCMDCNILVQGTDLPREARTRNPKRLDLGMRLSTAEITRLGMKEAEMKDVARYMRRAVAGENSSKLAAEIEEFLKPHQSVRYSFSA